MFKMAKHQMCKVESKYILENFFLILNVHGRDYQASTATYKRRRKNVKFTGIITPKTCYILQVFRPISLANLAIYVSPAGSRQLCHCAHYEYETKRK